MTEAPIQEGRRPRPPSLLDAILPVVVLIALIALTIALFGVDATDGPLQVALLLSAAFASLIAFKNGYTVGRGREAAVGGVTHGDGRDLHPAGGRRPDRHVEHGRDDPDGRRLRDRAAHPDDLLLRDRGDLRARRDGHRELVDDGRHARRRVRRDGQVMGLVEAVAAGAVICGAYFGDKMTPLSETTILVPNLVGGVTVDRAHPQHVLDVGPALGSASSSSSSSGSRPTRRERQHGRGARRARERVQHLVLNLLPLRLLVVFTVRKVPPFLAILGVRAVRRHPRLLHAVGRGQGLRGRARPGPVATGIKAIYAAMATGFVSASGNPASTSSSPAAAWPAS